MHLVYATGRPRRREFTITNTARSLPAGATVCAPCYGRRSIRNLDDALLGTMTKEMKSPDTMTPTLRLNTLTPTLRLASLVLAAIGLMFILSGAAQASTFVVTNTNTSGAGSLAEAILDANGNPGPDVITFNIPGSGVHTISPPNQLPPLNDPVTIDGYTQPGASPNTLAVGSNAVLLIELSGALANSAFGLNLSGGNCTIRGLIINRFNFYGIYIASNGDNVIAGNYIGTNASGTSSFPAPNNGSGIYLTTPHNTIGGQSPADRNVLSGNGNANGGTGLYINTASAVGNKVINNYIGLDANGVGSIPNYNNGVFLVGGSSQSIVGGTTASERNVISNNYYGISINGSSSNQVMGNYIGTRADGTASFGNSCGVSFSNASNNTVGGTSPGAGNLIAWNTGAGVVVVKNCVNDAILGNSIYSNSYQLGIDLYDGGFGVTPNDNNTGDADSGPNNLQNFPVLTSVISNGGTTTIEGTLDSAFSSPFRIELFSNNACDPTGFGQGQSYLGFANVTTDAGGHGSFTFNVPNANVVGGFFSATATDPNGNTSEFSACASGVVSSPGTLQFSTNIISQLENSGSFTINVTRTNGSTGTVTVQYATADGTATSPSDYTSTAGTLTFNDGETSKPITIPIVDDSTPEGSETFKISITNPSGGAILGSIASATLSIQDNDLPTLSISDVSQAEGNSGTTAFIFTVTSSNSLNNDVNVNYATANGSATAGSDYQTTSGTLIIPAGQTSKTITVNVTGDTTKEPDEVFFVDLSLAGGATIAKAQGIGTIINDDGTQPSTLQFDQSSYTVQESLSALTITVTRSGDTSGTASVDYVTNDGTATQKGDFEYTAGTLTFAAGETSKTLTVLINEDAYIEGDEIFQVALSNPAGASLDQPSYTSVKIVDDMPESATNPVDDAQQFVYTHYHDFLNREPDPAGLQFWTNEIESCGADAQCREVRRSNVSAAFFLSIEFQQTGFLLHLMQKESFALMPKYNSFIRDLQEVGRGVIVTAPGWEQKLKDNQEQFAERWVKRPEFRAIYDAMSNADYVNSLYANAGVVPLQAEKEALVAQLDAASETRAAVLLEVAANSTFRQQEHSPAFVLMQYFGYLRRDPDAAPDWDLSGYGFWLNKLNSLGGDFQQSEMVKAFITSVEYRQRFGQ